MGAAALTRRRAKPYDAWGLLFLVIPLERLTSINRILSPSGMTVVDEGNDDSLWFHCEDVAARFVLVCLMLFVNLSTVDLVVLSVG